MLLRDVRKLFFSSPLGWGGGLLLLRESKTRRWSVSVDYWHKFFLNSWYNPFAKHSHSRGCGALEMRSLTLSATLRTVLPDMHTPEVLGTKGCTTDVFSYVSSRLLPRTSDNILYPCLILWGTLQQESKNETDKILLICNLHEKLNIPAPLKSVRKLLIPWI